VDENQMFQREILGIQEGLAAAPEAEFAENRHGQIPFS
jgi:hypothetical protein